MSAPKCDLCKFYTGRSCRRYPPTAINAQWPIVEPMDWCGEYQPNEKERMHQYNQSMKGDY